MPRSTIIATVALAALATTVAPAPSLAEEVSYEQHDVRADPKKGPAEHVTLKVPADWDRQRLNRVSVGFFNQTARPQTIVVDLDPRNDTAEELRAEAETLRDLGPRYYREHDFRVNDEDDEITARWVFSYRDAQTGDDWSYTSVLLFDDERLEIDGRRVDKEELKQVRTRVVRSFQILK